MGHSDGIHMASMSTSVNISTKQHAQVFTKTLHAVSCGMKGTTEQPSTSFCCSCQGCRSTLFLGFCISWETVKQAAVTSWDKKAVTHLESFTDITIIVHHLILPRLSFGALQNTSSLSRACPSRGLLRPAVHPEKGNLKGAVLWASSFSLIKQSPWKHVL